MKSKKKGNSVAYSFDHVLFFPYPYLIYHCGVDDAVALAGGWFRTVLSNDENSYYALLRIRHQEMHIVSVCGLWPRK